MTPIDAAPLLSWNEEIDLPQGGHGAIALALEHAEEQSVRVSVASELLGAQEGAPQLSLFEVAMVVRADGMLQGDPLLPIAKGELEVAPGESRQLWVDVSTLGAAAGKYTLRVRIEAVIKGQTISRVLDVPIHVWALAPQSVTPSTVVWGYLNSPPIRGLSKLAADDMLAHGVTAAVLPVADLPWPKTGALATGTSIGDYGKFDEAMEVLSRRVSCGRNSTSSP